MEVIKSEDAIKSIVASSVRAFASGFSVRHIAEKNNPNGVINLKINNVFIEALGMEIRYYSALVRSLDSSLGNMLEEMAVSIAELFYDVKRNVEGPLSVEQTRFIAELLEKYKRHQIKPSIQDYLSLREKSVDNLQSKRHDSDYYLIDKENKNRYLIELKIGGDLDNKKARSEKEALLEQYAILSNTLEENNDIKIFFATGYNRFGEDNPWTQTRVLQFFASEELLIGKNFWNFICKSDQGYKIVIDTYREEAHLIKEALENIKNIYLQNEEVKRN